MIHGVRRFPVVRELWWTAFLRRNDTPLRRPTEVEPMVHVGGACSRRRWGLLRTRGVCNVIWLMSEMPPPAWLGESHRVLWLPVPDQHGLTTQQMTAGCIFLDQVREDEQGVFVACGAGIGRAPTMYLAWCIWRGDPLEIKMAVLHRLRPVSLLTAAQLRALELFRGSLRSNA